METIIEILTKASCRYFVRETAVRRGNETLSMSADAAELMEQP